MAGRTDGAIGYVEYAYALQNKMNYTQLKNRDGKFVAPGHQGLPGRRRRRRLEQRAGFLACVLTDQPGTESWPITGATFILMHKQQTGPAEGASRCSISSTGPIATATRWPRSCDYVPMPEKVARPGRGEWKKESSARTESRSGPGRPRNPHRRCRGREQAPLPLPACAAFG